MEDYLDIQKTERDLLTYYLKNEIPLADQIPAKSIHDPIASCVQQAMALAESKGTPLSIVNLSNQLGKLSNLPTEIGKIVAIMCDAEAMNMPDAIALQLETQIKESHAKRQIAHLFQKTEHELGSTSSRSIISNIHSSLSGIHASLGEEIWNDPQPIFEVIPETPYPVDSLPEIIHDAVRDVHETTQAPLSMVALSAITNASVCVQHIADIARDSQLQGPISIFGIIVAESGERKTCCDQLFNKAIREFQRSEKDRLTVDMQRWKADHQTWEAKREGVKTAVRSAAKAGKNTSELQEKIREIEKEEPKPPRIPSLIMENETPASLRNKLSYMTPKAWLSVTLASSEGGNIFGGHGMKAETALEYLALLNSLWDGKDISAGRVGDGDRNIEGARLTFSVSVQEEVIRNFIRSSLARQTGLLARVLFAWPDSTRGKRLYRKPPKMEGLAKYSAKVKRFLEIKPNRDEMGRIIPALLKMSCDAQAIWIKFYDSTEERQQVTKDLHEFPDIASKAADHAARLIGIFHFWDGGTVSEDVGAEIVTKACEIAEWHLNEAHRFLCIGSQNQEVIDGIELDNWIRSKILEGLSDSISKREVQQLGPNRLRKSERLDKAINFLRKKNRIRECKAGKQVRVEINPVLLEVKAPSSATSLHLLQIGQHSQL